MEQEVPAYTGRLPAIPQIRCFVTLSSSRLNDDDRRWLIARAHEASAFVGCYGYFVHCQEDIDDLGKISRDPSRPPNLTKLLEWAISLGCAYVLFDVDAH